jgi:hypothetical protein
MSNYCKLGCITPTLQSLTSDFLLVCASCKVWGHHSDLVLLLLLLLCLSGITLMMRV